MIDVLVPTFGRADRLAAVARNIREATAGVDHRVVFIIEDDDLASRDALHACAETHVCLTNARARNYAGACNTAYHALDGDHLFAGSDDLRFHPGWAQEALARLASNPWTQVAGTNDLLNPYVAQGTHATHYLIERGYLDREGGCVDEGPGSFLHEGYDHQYTDTEFIGTAKARARFLPCHESVVEHMHFLAGKSPHDDTYVRAYADEVKDSQLYDERRALWQDLSR